MGHAYPVYLVVTPFSELAPSVRVLVRTLDKLVPYLPLAEGYYRADSDEALIGLCFEREAIEQVGEAKVLDAVRRCHLPMVVPDRLDPDQRAAFVQEHLTTYHTFVQQYRSPDPGPSLIERVFTALEEHVEHVVPDQVADDEYLSMEVSTDEDLPTEDLPTEDLPTQDLSIADLSDEDAPLDALVGLDDPVHAQPIAHQRSDTVRATSEWEMVVDGLLDDSASDPDAWP